MNQATYQCQGCKHTQRLMINGPKECQRCGGTFERIQHPLQANPNHVAVRGEVIAYGRVGGIIQFSEAAIMREFESLLEEANAILAAEVAMDRIEESWYNREGDLNGEEADEGDRV